MVPYNPQFSQKAVYPSWTAMSDILNGLPANRIKDMKVVMDEKAGYTALTGRLSPEFPHTAIDLRSIEKFPYP